MSWSLIAIAPDERSRPSLRQRISVVLPAPFGPTSDSSSPWWASKLTLRSTLRLPKCFATACTVSATRPRPARPCAVAGAATKRPDDGAAAPVSRPRAPRLNHPPSAGSSPFGITTITNTNATPRISFQTNGRSPPR